jgi:2'-5' RNA ligase
LESFAKTVSSAISGDSFTERHAVHLPSACAALEFPESYRCLPLIEDPRSSGKGAMVGKLENSESEPHRSVTALVVLVSEAEPAVGRWRAKYDWSAQHGMPPHITVLLPFLQSHFLSGRDMSLLRNIFADEKSFEFQLGSALRFNNYVYLSPEPLEPFVRFTNLVLGEYRNLTPYGGMFETVVPHLTVAYERDQSVLAHILRELADFQVSAVADTVRLMECRDQWWRSVAEFPLGIHLATETS